MSTADLIDSHVSTNQCKKAVSALIKHVLKTSKQKEETQLLPDREENVWLVVTVKKDHPEKKLKPFKIPLKHSLIDPRETPVCLITKDPQREYKDLLESHKITFISRVVGITKLKGKFRPFEARRLLLKENGMFLADERVIPLLPGLLGKKFFEAKKQPIPVCLTRKDLTGELERAISSTYMHQNQGTCTSVKIGTVSQTPEMILDNLTVALPAIVKNIKDGWDNIQSFNIKTSASVSLPIWSCKLGRGEGARWSAESADSGEWSGFGAEEEADGSLPKPTVSEEVAIGKKRAAKEDSSVTPKKAKVVEGSTETSKRRKGKKGSEEEQPTLKKKTSPADTKTEASRSSSQPTPQPTTVSVTGTQKQSEKPTKKDSVAPKSPANPSKAPASETKRLNAVSFDKKKEKVVKGNVGKRAKDVLVGKAVKARV